ncbi:glycerol-3-phosphate 1-O-acyltransferase PlsY [Thalassospira lucentensis]|uniref:glycerol-3-phosphate 1-O-acyltransferase PlsY n=1 Tax=Thalassospira lucentensis TaxID=168935 RepID=UPI001B7FD51F|nr:glycerol-3-phosphate 1-O-acyltransferase PlsY [Thalassospira lucentensis]
MELAKISAAIGFGYLLGSLNSSIIVSRFWGIDVRQHGSKSAGLTNVLRTLGVPAAILVLVFDVLKGVVACLFGDWLGIFVQTGDAVDSLGALLAGAAVVVGHNWPIFFKFRGGKGALTAAAVMIMLSWSTALMSLGVFATVILLTRYVSLGTILAVVFFSTYTVLFSSSHTIYFNVTVILLACIIVFKHRANVVRLMSGSENKLRF